MHICFYTVVLTNQHLGDRHVCGSLPYQQLLFVAIIRERYDTISNNDSPYSPTMTQPYVYWTLNAPFATIIGLYSNVDGTLDARGTSEQLQWFQQQVQSAPADKALIVAVHHPPYSLDTTHGGYPDIEIAHTYDRSLRPCAFLSTVSTQVGSQKGRPIHCGWRGRLCKYA